jgi:hypothetical protein
MSNELTPWFPSSVKPVRKGVYQTDWYGVGYSQWSGQEWSNQDEKIEEAAMRPNWDMGAQDKPWRGLAKNPKGGK